MVVVMRGVASSTVFLKWKLPTWVGNVAVTVLVIVTIVFCLDGILKTLSRIDLVIIMMILIVPTDTLLKINFWKN